MVSGDVGWLEMGSFLICGDGCGDVTEDAAFDDVGDCKALRLRGVICMV